MIQFERCKGWDNENTLLPSRNTPGSAGYDFFMPVLEGNFTSKGKSYLRLMPGESASFQTGVKIKMKDNMFLMTVPRNSTGTKKNCCLVNTIGIIDADYYSNPENDGNIGFVIRNFGDHPALFPVAEPFAQGIILQYHTCHPEIVRNPVRKGATFFGSLGKK